MSQNLTPKQGAFVREYLIDLNATQAAIRAGYSSKRADAIGYENLRKPVIANAIQSAMNERAERVQRSADDVLKDIQKVKESCMSEAADQFGNIAMVDAKAALKALELEGRHLKMFTDKIEHSGKVGLESLIAGGE
jgi:phage terminase small subunit